MSRPLYLECRDHNGDLRNLTIKGWAELMESIGMAEGNSANTIWKRYNNKKKRGLTIRQVIGLEEIERIVPSQSKKRVKPPQTLINRFLAKRLV